METKTARLDRLEREIRSHEQMKTLILQSLANLSNRLTNKPIVARFQDLYTCEEEALVRIRAQREELLNELWFED